MVTPPDCSANIAAKQKRAHEGHVVFDATATRGRDAAGTTDIFIRDLSAA
jgi:hypothetical protein